MHHTEKKSQRPCALTEHSAHGGAFAGLADLQRYTSEYFRGSQADQRGRLYTFLREHSDIHRNWPHRTEPPSVRSNSIINESSVEVLGIKSLKGLYLHGKSNCKSTLSVVIFVRSRRFCIYFSGVLQRGRGTCEREISLCALASSFSFHTTEKCTVLAHSTTMRGGRGGGRGRGRSAPSAGQDLIRETQMDLGIDKFGPDQVSSALARFQSCHGKGTS